MVDVVLAILLPVARFRAMAQYRDPAGLGAIPPTTDPATSSPTTVTASATRLGVSCLRNQNPSGISRRLDTGAATDLLNQHVGTSPQSAEHTAAQVSPYEQQGYVPPGNVL